MRHPDKIFAPFSAPVVDAINDWQRHNSIVHPLTCPDRRTNEHYRSASSAGILRAMYGRGLICPDCPYTQDWVPASMVDRDAIGRIFLPHRMVEATKVLYGDALHRVDANG